MIIDRHPNDNYVSRCQRKWLDKVCQLETIFLFICSDILSDLIEIRLLSCLRGLSAGREEACAASCWHYRPGSWCWATGSDEAEETSKGGIWIIAQYCLIMWAAVSAIDLKCKLQEIRPQGWWSKEFRLDENRPIGKEQRQQQLMKQLRMSNEHRSPVLFTQFLFPSLCLSSEFQLRLRDEASRWHRPTHTTAPSSFLRFCFDPSVRECVNRVITRNPSWMIRFPDTTNGLLIRHFFWKRLNWLLPV